MIQSEIVAFYLASNPGCVLDDAAVTKQLQRAVAMYAGYATISALADGSVSPDADYALSASELAIIQPLFFLYCEQAGALLLEASRGMAIESFGRSTSEIAADITSYEAGLPRMAFYEAPLTI